MKIDAYPQSCIDMLLDKHPELRGAYLLGGFKVSTDCDPLVSPWTDWECLQSILFNLIVYNYGFL